MKIYEYVIRRLALMIFVLFGVSAIVFYLARGFPAAFAPWAQYITFRMKPSQIQAIIKAHGFDQPLYIQYWYWLGDVFRGDWGYSNWANGLPTYDVFASRFPFTVELTVAATILTVAIGVPLGILSALKNNTAADHASRNNSTNRLLDAFLLVCLHFAARVLLLFLHVGPPEPTERRRHKSRSCGH